MSKTDKIKILHISQVEGGIQTYMEQILDNIDRNKFEILLVAPEHRKSIVKMADRYKIKWINLNLATEISPLQDLKDVFAINRIIREVKPDLVHVHSSKAGMVVRLASMFYKQKTFYTPNAYAYLGKKGLTRSFFLNVEKVAIPFTDILLAASVSEANRSLKDLKFPEKKVEIYPNSIEILQPGEKIAHEGKKIITMVGRLVNQKNPMMFARVCKEVTATRNDVFFQIIGAGFDDQFKLELEKYLKDNDLNEKFSIVQWMSRDNLLTTIRNTDVFVMTSLFESFGYVAAEAQMLEIPVVATNVDGLNEIVEHNSTGFLVEPNDDRGMAEKIIYLLDNPEKAGEMGKAGRIRISQLFDIKKNINILQEIYLEHSSKVRSK